MLSADDIAKRKAELGLVSSDPGGSNWATRESSTAQAEAQGLPYAGLRNFGPAPTKAPAAAPTPMSAAAPTPSIPAAAVAGTGGTTAGGAGDGGAAPAAFAGLKSSIPDIGGGGIGGGGGEGATGAQFIVAPGSLRQGIGTRIPPEMSQVLAGLRNIY